MNRKIFNLSVLIICLAILLGTSGAAAQKPTYILHYQQREGVAQQHAWNVRLVSSYNTPGQSIDVTVSGDYAYVADMEHGLRIIDISDLTTPAEVGSYDTPGDAKGVTVSGNYAYVATDWVGLSIIDISDPTTPAEVGFYDTPEDAKDVAVVGNYAYVAEGWTGLRIIDVSDPTNPSEAGFYDTPGSALAVAVAGNYAYVANEGDSCLLIIDVSDPTNPSEVGFYNTPGAALGVAVVGNYAYVAGGLSGLRIIDVSEPTNPTEAGFYDWSNSGLHYDAIDVVVAEGYAYVVDGRDVGLRIIDISNPTNPSEVGFYDTSAANGVVVAGNHVYVANGWQYGLVILRFFSHQVHLPVTIRDYGSSGFYDDFSDPSSGWPVGDDGNIRYEYLNGEYEIYISNPYWWAAARPGFQASDYILEADVRNISGKNGSYGLIFGLSSDWSQFYTFEIDAYGNYGIYRYYSGSWETLAEGTSSSINTGTTKNRLKIKREGNFIEAYANGQLLTSISDGTYTGMRYMGLYNGTFDVCCFNVRYDNFAVYPPMSNLDSNQIGEIFQTPSSESLESMKQRQIFSQPNNRKQ